MLDNPKIKKSIEGKGDLKKYLELAPGYKPLQIEAITSKTHIQDLQKAGVVDSDLNINPPDALVDRSAGFVVNITAIEERRGEYIYKLKLYEDDDPRAALLDLLYFAEDAKKRFKVAGHLMDELNAYIHQVLERTPVLFDFLFEGSRDYHMENSAETYKNCMR